MLFLYLPLEMAPVPPTPSELLSGSSFPAVDVILFLLPGLLGCYVEGCIQFVELVDSTLALSCL